MDELTERWHALADQPLEAIAFNYNERSIALINEVLRCNLGYTEPVQFDSAAEFAQYAIDLRKNEQAWSRHLGDAIIQAQALIDGENSSEAIAKLTSFISICPWHHFAEIAEIQKQNFIL
jgi:hypothetical protein